MKILIVSQVFNNPWAGGVYRYYQAITPYLQEMGHIVYPFGGNAVHLSQPGGALAAISFLADGINSKSFARFFEEVKPDCVHIQAEFGIGVGARNFCLQHNIPFSSAYHTHYDKFLPYYNAPVGFVWIPYCRWFYKPAKVVFAHTQTLKEYLQSTRIHNSIAVFPPGVDVEKWFYDPGLESLQGHPRPYFTTMSRISKEKNLEAFLDLDLPGTKIVVGEGPHKPHLMKKYRGKVLFFPYDKARKVLSTSDVFVVPSLIDTFNMTILEALACGLPVAAYPVMGPQDIIEQGVTGFTSNDLKEAALSCLFLKKEACIETAKRYSWKKTAEAFAKHQVVI